MKEQLNKAKNNPVGLLIGGFAGWFISKNVIKTESMWLTILVTGIGAYAGAMAQSNWSAKNSQPTANLIIK